MGVGNIAAQFLASSGSMVCLRFLFVFCVTFFFFGSPSKKHVTCGEMESTNVHDSTYTLPHSTVSKERDSEIAL
jgi:hypothetical protein